MPKKRPRNPHVAITEAYRKGRGLHLSADEVIELAEDDAIATRAAVVQEAAREARKAKA